MSTDIADTITKLTTVAKNLREAEREFEDAHLTGPTQDIETALALVKNAKAQSGDERRKTLESARDHYLSAYDQLTDNDQLQFYVFERPFRNDGLSAGGSLSHHIKELDGDYFPRT